MNKFSPSFAAAATIALLLAACGGSGGDDAQPVEDPTLIPASATSTTTTWFKFVSMLMPSDSSEALQMGNISELPTSESEEPMPLPQ